MKLSLKRDQAKGPRIIAVLLSFGFAATAAASTHTLNTTVVKTNRTASAKTAGATSQVTVHPPPLAQSNSQGSTDPAPGITYTCDANFATYGPAGLCAALNSILPPIYSSVFTNANASIYILFDPSAGLGESVQYNNTVSYSVYRAALLSESTDAAKAFVPAAEPAIFGTLPVGVTSALARNLGISGATSITAEGTSCSTPGVGDCYDAIVHIVTPAALLAETGSQGLSYRSLSGSTNGTTDNYDFFSVVEHETDEVLGTSSCVSYTGPGTVSTPTCVSAEDLFRYTSSGVRIFDTFAYSYFSPNGGVTDLENNTYNTTQGGGDWGDFSQICVFVQDAEACPSGTDPNNSFDITNDGPGGTRGPEVAMLNAVGYNLAADTTPPTVQLSGVVTGPPKQVLISSQDNPGGSGLASVVVTCTNCTASTAPFTVGTSDAVVTTATKTNQSLSSTVEVVATDVAGNVTTFDPVDVTLKSDGYLAEGTATISQSENIALISNGNPGMSLVTFVVDGTIVPPIFLNSGQSTKVNLASYLTQGPHNSVQIFAVGQNGATVWIVFTQR